LKNNNGIIDKKKIRTMNNKRHRQSKNVKKKQQERSVSCKEDAYSAVWILAKLGWSNRRIAKLKLPTSHNTVAAYFSEGCELIESGKLTISPRVRGIKNVILAGKPDDVAYLYGRVHENPCGGGKRGKRYRPDDWDD